MPFRTVRRRGATAFTLIEVLVVITVVAVLAAITLPVLASVQGRADRIAALSQMHQIAVAIPLYVGEHNGLLPGPLFPGQMPLLDPARSGRLVLTLAPYLNITIPTSPQLVPLFIPPAYKRAVSAAFLVNARTFVLNTAVSLGNGSAVVNPWGNSATGVGEPVASSLVPTQAWAFADADQQNPRVIGAPWVANTPPTPVHSPNRLAVRFDGSAGEITLTELALSAP